MNVQAEVKACGIIPVVVLERVEDAVPLAQAMLKGGIHFAEVTFRTAAALESIQRIAKEVPDMIVGAGTVLSVEQCKAAVEAGAKFIVSPGFDPDVVRAAQALNIPIFPGVVTPSEIMQGIKMGLEIFKFFPAGNYGGLKTIKALSGPFPQISFLPTGGVSMDNMHEFLAFEKVVAVGGSWPCAKPLIAAKAWDEISGICEGSRKIFLQVRKEAQDRAGQKGQD